jgi:hypothetical protein
VSKKKFSSGLDSLFDTKQEETEVVHQSTPSVKDAFLSDTIAQPAINRKASSKNFTSDLDSLFQDAFTDAVEQKIDKLRRTSGLEDAFENEARPFKQPLSGLDALIRSTIDTSLAGLEHAPIKRLTIMFESQKIDKLKSIAKNEKAFVKDIVNEVLTEFIKDYEKRRGGAL